MMFKTHLAFGILLALLTFNYFDNINKYLFVLITVVSAIFLDIDEENSFIGRRTKPLSSLINTMFKHRGFIHSFLFISIISILIWFFSGNYYIPFLIGTLGHLFLDSLTVAGVRILYPLKFRTRFVFKTGSIFDLSLFLIIILGILVLYLTNFKESLLNYIL